jgi:cytochrome c oxidase subunit II
MLAGIALTLVSLWYGQNHGLLPVAASAEAEMVDGLFNTMMIVSVGLFILVQAVLIIAIFKFRRRRGDNTDGPPIHGNVPLEILWTAIPAVIVLVIGVYSFDVYKNLGGFDPEAATDPGVTQIAMLPSDDITAPLTAPLINSAKVKPAHHHIALGVGAFPEDEGKPADLVVNVMGLQYAWIFNYPSGVTSGELHVPVDQEVQLNINAQDVLHAFWLPEFRLKQDAIPGRLTELRFKPRRVGEYPVICAELCGAYHGGMVTKLYVHPQEDYNSWLQSQMASNSDLSQSVAYTPNSRSNADFLAPVAADLGITAETLEQLHPQS